VLTIKVWSWISNCFPQHLLFVISLHQRSYPKDLWLHYFNNFPGSKLYIDIPTTELDRESMMNMVQAHNRTMTCSTHPQAMNYFKWLKSSPMQDANGIPMIRYPMDQMDMMSHFMIHVGTPFGPKSMIQVGKGAVSSLISPCNSDCLEYKQESDSWTRLTRLSSRVPLWSEKDSWKACTSL